ncbi:MAG: hypothetical protein IPJ65_32115 [Archangiaceae bacterium]|nr:hypothetical protein [Archangiaceae bacterium]
MASSNLPTSNSTRPSEMVASSFTLRSRSSRGLATLIFLKVAIASSYFLSFTWPTPMK